MSQWTRYPASGGSSGPTQTEYNAGNSGSALTIDFAHSINQKVTLTANCTFTFSNPTAGTIYLIKLVQDATGSRLVTWPASVKWVGAAAPTLTTAPSATDIVTLYYDGTNYYGTAGLNYA
jgi:hypothetical protein